MKTIVIVLTALVLSTAAYAGGTRGDNSKGGPGPSHSSSASKPDCGRPVSQSNHTPK